MTTIKPGAILGALIVGLAVALVLAPGLGVSSPQPSTPDVQAQTIAAVETPLPTATQQPVATPQPQIIYVQIPPQTIYVSVPAGEAPPAPPPIVETVSAPALFPTAAPTSTFVPTTTPSPTRTPVPTATPVLVRGQVIVNFAGAPIQRSTVSANFAVAPGKAAWDAIKQAIGVSNITCQDFGGSLGIFITGFYGAQAQGNHFWEFLINGQSASVGVSGYQPQDGDVLEFRYSSF